MGGPISYGPMDATVTQTIGPPYDYSKSAKMLR